MRHASVYGTLRRLYGPGLLTSYAINEPGRVRLAETTVRWHAFATTTEGLVGT